MSQFEFDDDDEPYVVIEKHSSDVSSLLMGLAIGAGIALLFAPHSGAETRRRIRRGVGRVTDAAMETFEVARAEVEDRVGAVRDAVDVKKEQVSRAVEAGRAAAQAARDELERRIADTKAQYTTSGGQRLRTPRAPALDDDISGV
jgi:gas vesicle protein